MSDCVIFDLDGTLANLDHRLHHIKDGKKDWDAFFAAMADDTPNGPVAKLAKALADGDHSIVICSGRPEGYRPVIESWLQYHRINFDALYLRPDGDYRPDQIIKAEILRILREDGWEPWVVVDDRQRVVDMWRSHDLTCLQCAPGDFDNPKPKVAPGRLVVLVGPSGAGKSWFADESFDRNAVVSSDDLRHAICGDWRDQTRNAEVFHALHEIVRTRIACGLFTVVDATNIKTADRKAVTACAPETAKIEYYVIDRPMAEKMRDAGWRAGIQINGVSLIERHHNTFQSNLKDILNGDGDPRVTVVDLRKKAERAA